MRWVVIVNGPPGSGKTTLARRLAPALSVPLFSKDSVKERLLDELGYADRDSSRKIGAASGEVLWTLLAESTTCAVIESWLEPGLRTLVESRLHTAEVDRMVEVWCSCPPDIARERFAVRQRHPGHFDTDFLDRYDETYAAAAPLDLGSVITVDTSSTVDLPSLMQAIYMELAV